ncbi:helix-turn-helix domain-containing protein [Cryptosporangium sp. NPDC048952]|uniref:helix-turn-helix domain-containing protein n=1 Tax=Cryptosporangium sp. NPDC048952 TaxID=3363961 RepID=UPI003724814A
MPGTFSTFHSRSGPPPIPGARSDSTGHPRRPLLIWVRTGTAHVCIDHAVTFRLTAGEGAWIPADGWDHRAIVTEPGTVAFPLWPRPGAGSLSEPTRLAVPDGWQDWLIQLFNLQVTPLTGQGYSPDGLVDLLHHSGSRSFVPPMPKARGARSVAEELVRDPSLDLTVEQWATRVLSSPRTLRRDFLAGSGLTFEQWRRQLRLSAGVDFLASGYDVDRVAARVGFASRNGFTRAFKERLGLTPNEFSRKHSVSTARPVTPPNLLRASTPPHTNPHHVLSWMYRGSGFLDIGDHRYERQRGVATWIPADVEHTTGIHENSISLPLGDADPTDLRLTEPMQVQFSPAWDDYLMYCSISARSILRPDDYDPRHIVDLFAEQVAAQQALSVPMPMGLRARAAAIEYLRRIGASDESAAHDVPAEVQRAFRDEIGMTFSRWRYAARMRIARDLLVGGTKPSAVARRIGYRHPPTFSAAFSRFHGVSPREYQEREIGKA